MNLDFLLFIKTFKAQYTKIQTFHKFILLFILIGIPEKWDQEPGVGQRTQDPVVGPWGGTLGWNPRVGPWCRTLCWDPDGTLGWDPGVESWGGTLGWKPGVGPCGGTQE